MTRSRSSNSPAVASATTSVAPTQPNTSRIRAAGLRVMNPTSPEQPSSSSSSSQLPNSEQPSIRLVPYSDPRSPRPSLSFPTLTRTLTNLSSTIRVGRYSEKDAAAAEALNNVVSDAPVGFKSKVVSRKHCEFFYEDNQWHIKDVKSSSGTFLNHIRLSPPGEESKPFAVKDGDLVQLGIDFKGGEEVIFRCVKIRILCNRGWQKSLNKFNKSAHRQLSDLQRSTSSKSPDKQFKDSTECTICLNSIAPCQTLFVAPCSHTWHYKCIRPMLEESHSPGNFSQFLCPNCRAVADLDADVEEVPSLWEEDFSDSDLADVPAPLKVNAHNVPEGNARTRAISETPEYLLDNDMDALAIQDRFQQNPHFGLPPPSTSVSRENSTRGLNPGASAFIPTRTSDIPYLAPERPRSGSPSRAVSSDSAPTAVAFALSMPPGHISTPSTNELHSSSRPVSSSSLPRSVPNGSSRNSSSAADRANGHPSNTRYQQEASPSPADDDDNEYDLPPLNSARTISPTTSSNYSALFREDGRSFFTQDSPDGEHEGPMTPRNHAGPYIFGGGALGTASPGNEESYASLTLNNTATV